MDPVDDPEEFIAASIWYHPLIFPTRTEVLEHTLLVNGNGYEWGKDGKIRSVFAHIEPDFAEGSLQHYLRDAEKEKIKEAKFTQEQYPDKYRMSVYYREEYARLRVIQLDYRYRAHTYGPIRDTEQYDPDDGRKRRARMITSSDLKWTLLGQAPEHVHPVWQPYLSETRELFAPVLTEQGTLGEDSQVPAGT
jgi:hypothetical protein